MVSAETIITVVDVHRRVIACAASGRSRGHQFTIAAGLDFNSAALQATTPSRCPGRHSLQNGKNQAQIARPQAQHEQTCDTNVLFILPPPIDDHGQCSDRFIIRVVQSPRIRLLHGLDLVTGRCCRVSHVPHEDKSTMMSTKL